MQTSNKVTSDSANSLRQRPSNHARTEMANENVPNNKRDLPDMASQEDALNHVL